MKKILIGLIIITFLVLLAGAVEENHEAIFKQAQEIIEKQIPCNELTENQLEILGDYYMEQMHPGEVHERMDAMMGGEGSESLKQVHINMGLRFYCGGNKGYYGGMMGMMNPLTGRTYYSYNNQNNFNLISYIPMVLIVIILILVIILLIKNINSKKK